MTTIYKICERAVWREAEAAGQFLGTEADERDGFIHFSSATQLAETAAKHYANKTGLVLVAVDGDTLGMALDWERSHSSDLFPHLYAVLPLAAVKSARPLPAAAEGRHPLPSFEP